MAPFLEARRKLGREGWRLQMFNMKFRDILPKGLKSWPNPGWGPSAGMMAFWVATALCKSISLYGFQGVVAGKNYHAYAWCDVDRIFKIETNDCKIARGNGGRRLSNSSLG